MAERICSIEGCGKPFLARGLCSMHYQQAKLDPLPRRSAAERLAARLVRAANGCLEWTGAVNPKGYGLISVGSYVDETKRMVLTHRLAWELADGPIPDELCILHHCDRPPCCDVEHLFLGTKVDNNADMYAKGRYINAPSLKTHCPQGHAYNEANTYHWHGRRFCRECHLATQYRYLQRIASL